MRVIAKLSVVIGALLFAVPTASAEDLRAWEAGAGAEAAYRGPAIRQPASVAPPVSSMRVPAATPEVVPTSADPCAPSCPPCCMPYEMPCAEDCCWRFELTIGGWLPALDGHVTVRGRRLDVDLSSSEFLETFIDYGEFVFQGRLRASRNRFTLSLSGLTVGFEKGVEFTEGGTRGVDAEIGMDMLQFDVGYCIRKCPLGSPCGCPAWVAYEALVGLRYVNMDGDIEPRGALPGVSGDQDFVDPLVGFRVTADLGNRWAFELEGDIGGFSVGSDLTWGLRAAAKYRLARWASIELGYKALDIDYADGSGSDRFEWDVLMHGPYLALSFHL